MTVVRLSDRRRFRDAAAGRRDTRENVWQAVNSFESVAPRL